MLRNNSKRPRFYALIALVLCSMGLSACGLQPAIVDEPKPTSTPVTANVPDVEKDKPSKPGPQPGVEATLSPWEFTYANGVPFPVPSSEANPIRISTMEEAWGANVKVEEFPTLIDPEHIFHLRGIDEEGRFLVGEVMTGTTPTTQNDLTHLAIIDTQTREITHIPDSTRNNEANYTYSSVAVNGDWVVWLGKGGVPGNNPIKAYNRVSGKQITLDVPFADYKDLLGPFVSGPPIGANSVDRSIVVWAELSGEVVKGKAATVIKSYNLETGETVEVGKYGVRPVISWPYVAWLEPNFSSEVDGEYLSTIIVYNLQTGANRTLDNSWTLRELAAYDDVIGYISSGSGFTVNIEQTRRQVITPYGYVQAQKLTINDRLVAFAALNGPTAWDRKLEEIVRLPGLSGFPQGYYDACIVNGHMLTWQSGPSGVDLSQSAASIPPEDVKIYVLDTGLLP